jgi:hypothetical protein
LWAGCSHRYSLNSSLLLGLTSRKATDRALNKPQCKRNPRGMLPENCKRCMGSLEDNTIQRAEKPCLTEKAVTRAGLSQWPAFQAGPLFPHELHKGVMALLYIPHISRRKSSVIQGPKCTSTDKSTPDVLLLRFGFLRRQKLSAALASSAAALGACRAALMCFYGYCWYSYG